MSQLREQLQSALGATYTLERELGGGGMSRVFVADEVALGRQVVIKVIAAELLEGVSTERFAREVKLAARLQHANIVPLHSAGVAAGLPFYTMPFVRGETLRARVSRGPLPLSEAVGILRDIARALAHAHGQGVVHRDIKPENVLLSGGAAMVADFGIAKAMSDARTQGDGAAVMLTQAGNSLGTPAYMAPEQAAGDPRTDHRADLYAWGVIAYELLVGAHPFAEATTVHAMIAAHMAHTPAALSTRRDDVPAALGDVVTRSLAKDAAERPHTAAEVLDALEGISTPRTKFVEAPASRAPRALFAVPALMALVLIAWAATRQGAATPPKALAASAAVADSAGAVRSLVVLPFESVGGDTANAYFAEGMADELSNALTKVPGLQLAGRSSAAAFRGKQVSAQDIGAALKVGGVLEGAVRRAGDRLRVSAQLTNARTGLVMWSESFERNANDVFAVQDDITKAIVRALQVALVDGTSSMPAVAQGTDNLAAYDLYQRGMYFYQRRGPGLVKARGYLEEAIAKDPTFARAHAGLGLAWIASAIYTDVPMTDALPRALAAGARAVAIDSGSADGWAAIGLARTYQHRWRDADEATQRAVRVDGGSSRAHLYRSRYLLATGQVDEAVTAAQRAVELDPVNGVTLGYEALALSIAGRHEEAIAAGNRGWEIDSTVAGVTSYSLIALLDGGQLAEAKRRADVVLRTTRDIVGLSGAIWAIGASGDTARAAVMARDVSARFRGSSRLQSALSGAWLVAGDTAQALTAMERATERLEIGVVNMPLSHRRYDVLRGNPRFAALVRKLGLDVALFTSPNGGRPR
ncbi:protein kinase domain-containing protein [Gemmatimonas sp.]|uniref:protein kinase domain-containing protein n=1 Tax=Gemmatimonas sp. TaxID=1962908 RepID=UPI003DA37C4C